MQVRSFDIYLDALETAVKNIDPLTALGFKETLHRKLRDAIFGLAYDSEVLDCLRALDQPAQNLQASILFARADLVTRKAEMLSALERLRKAMNSCPPSATALCISLP